MKRTLFEKYISLKIYLWLYALFNAYTYVSFNAMKFLYNKILSKWLQRDWNEEGFTWLDFAELS